MKNEVGMGLRLLYAGCGPGQTLRALCDQSDLWSQILAVDFSAKVTEQARLALGLRMRSNLEVADLDFMRMHEYAGPTTMREFDLVACLNNTLGNVVGKDISLASTERQRCVTEFLRVLRPGGKVILSVYNAEYFDAQAMVRRRQYSRDLTLVTELSDFRRHDLVLRFNGTQLLFYSHWFSDIEVRKLLEDSGFVGVCIRKEGEGKPPVRFVGVGAKPIFSKNDTVVPYNASNTGGAAFGGSCKRTAEPIFCFA